MTADQCAQILLESIPEIMQVIRSEVRRQRGTELSVPQLRVLAFLARNPGATLSAVAEYVGLTLSSTSLQVTSLVARTLVERTESPTDRRCIILTLTEQGRAQLDAAAHSAQVSLASNLATLSADQRAAIGRTLQLLRSVFAT